MAAVHEFGSLHPLVSLKQALKPVLIQRSYRFRQIPIGLGIL